MSKRKGILGRVAARVAKPRSAAARGGGGARAGRAGGSSVNARKTARPAPVPAAAEAPVRLARVARGKKPQYFSDPAIDKLLWITTTLIGELSVTRDRLDAVERLLEQRRVLKVADVDGYEPTAEAEAARERRRQAYLDRVLRAVQAELEEMTGRGMPRSADEVVAAVSE